MGKMASGTEARRQFTPALLRNGIELRRRLLTATQATSLRDAAKQAEEFADIATGYRELAQAVEGLAEHSAARLTAETMDIASLLCRYISGVMDASEGADRALRAARARAASLLEEITGGDAETAEMPNATSEALAHLLPQVVAVMELTEIRSVLGSLGFLPLSTFYSEAYDPYGWIAELRRKRTAPNSDITHADHDDGETTPVVVKLLFALDGQPLQTVQALKSGVNYDFSVHAAATAWPRSTPRLQVDYVSALNTQDWAFSPFDLSPAQAGQLSTEARGHLVVRAVQNLVSPPASFRVRARFLSPDGERTRPVTVIGNHELRLHALNADSYPVLTQYPVVDAQVVKVLHEAKRALPGVPPDEFADFQRCLVYVARYAGMILQSGVFKRGNFAQGRIDEKRDFQQHLLQHLRVSMSPDVREGESGAGGLLDLRYRNIVIELKVEYDLKDRDRLRTKYIRQPAQYSATATPLSIVCILDMTEKDAPPANFANNITLEAPSQHGFAEGATPAFPARVAVVIVDGNTKLPSDYS